MPLGICDRRGGGQGITVPERPTWHQVADIAAKVDGAQPGMKGICTLVVAAWARYAEGQDEQGRAIEVVDKLRDQLIERARRQRDEPLIFISDRDLFGDLIDSERFVLAYGSALDSLHSRGARGTLEAAADKV